MPDVITASGHPRSTVYRRIAEGLFTRPIALGARSVAWPASEVAAINAARIAGMTDDEIRALVKNLEAARTNLAGAVMQLSTAILRPHPPRAGGR
jgi:prophage regulatory protein